MSPPPVPSAAPTLVDGDVTVRAHRPGDLAAVVRHARDPAMVRWTRVPTPYGPRDAEEYLAAVDAGWATGAEFLFAIEVGGEFCGSVGLRDQGRGAAEVGYALASELRGEGIMGRALRLVLTWGFEVLGLEVVLWRAEVGNWPSRRVAWAAGFRVEGAVRGLLPRREGRADGWIGSLRAGEEFVPRHAWFDPPLLSAGGVVLRPHDDHDLARIVEACRDEDIRRWIPWIPWEPEGYGEEDAAARLLQLRTEQASGTAVYWAVAEPGDGRLIGEIGVFVRDHGGHAGEIGYWTHPDGRCRGLTSTAVRLAARHALLPVEDGGLGMDRLLLRAAAGNVASRRVAEKAGFVRAGIDRRGGRLGDGSLDDFVRYDLLPDEVPPPAAPA